MPTPTAVIVPATRPLAVTALAVLFVLGGVLELALSFLSTFIVVLALISFGVAWGLWTGAKWSYWIGIVVGILLVLSFALFDIIGGFIGLFALYTFSRPTVKAWFNKSLR